MPCASAVERSLSQIRIDQTFVLCLDHIITWTLFQNAKCTMRLYYIHRVWYVYHHVLSGSSMENYLCGRLGENLNLIRRGFSLCYVLSTTDGSHSTSYGNTEPSLRVGLIWTV